MCPAASSVVVGLCRILFRSFYAIGLCVFFFFFNDTATTEIYTLSLHDALPIFRGVFTGSFRVRPSALRPLRGRRRWRSEEHTSELQSQSNLVCRLLLEKKKKTRPTYPATASVCRH